MPLRPIALSLLSIVTLVGACGGAATSPTPGGSTGTVATGQSIVGCEVTKSTPGTAVGVNGGPYVHQVAVGDSTDGVTVTNLRQVLDHASVPDGVRLPDGSIGIYYVNGETDGVWLARVSGNTVTPVSAITVDGIFRPEGIVDPDATAVGGKVRLTYLNGFGPPGSRRAMCIAESSDGLTFTTIANAWDLGVGATQTDPSLLQLPDGTWLMAISDGQTTRLGRSTNGLSFTEYQHFTAGGVPELGRTADGRTRLYVCEAGVTSYVSADNGVTWSRERVVVPGGALGRMIVCDPSWVPSAQLFVFKTQ
ncbi:MAG: hypothetical protein AB7L71_15980 [Vicinamibacterales bacterium]